jgi:hypothetical protein
LGERKASGDEGSADAIAARMDPDGVRVCDAEAGVRPDMSVGFGGGGGKVQNQVTMIDGDTKSERTSYKIQEVRWPRCTGNEPETPQGCVVTEALVQVSTQLYSGRPIVKTNGKSGAIVKVDCYTF